MAESSYDINLSEVDYNTLNACKETLPVIRDFLAQNGQGQMAYLCQQIFDVVRKIPEQSTLRRPRGRPRKEVAEVKAT